MGVYATMCVSVCVRTHARAKDAYKASELCFHHVGHKN